VIQQFFLLRASVYEFTLKSSGHISDVDRVLVGNDPPAWTHKTTHGFLMVSDLQGAVMHDRGDSKARTQSRNLSNPFDLYFSRATI
jgi:hypothetical protein